MDLILGRRRNLFMSAIAANIAFSSCGCCLAWTSPTLPLLAAPESFLLVNEEQGSWVGSLIAAGGIAGPLVASRLLDLIGRKYNLILDIILLLIAWAVLMVASEVWMLYLGRFLTGVAVGLIFMAVPLYIAEIAEFSPTDQDGYKIKLDSLAELHSEITLYTDATQVQVTLAVLSTTSVINVVGIVLYFAFDNLRGVLCSLNELFLAAGFVTAYAAGPYLSYRNLIFVCIIMPMCFLLIFLWMPESPHHLVAKGKDQEAIKTLRWLRGGVPEDVIEKEIIDIQELIRNSDDQLSLLQLTKSKGGARALFITSGLIFFQQFTGINAIQFYTQQIFRKATEVISPTISSIMLGAVQAISSVFTPAIVSHFGLKIPLLISALGTSFSQGFLGLYYYLDSSGSDVSSIIWLPISSLVAFTFFFCFGFGPLPWAVMGEMFPPNMKAISSATVTSFCFTLMFLITKFFSNVSIYLGSHSAFWLFSILCFVGFVFTYMFLPETKGMSLQDIQILLNSTDKSKGDKCEYEFSVRRRLSSKEDIDNNIERTSVLL